MYQIPAALWNEIAATEELSNPSFRRLMAMPQAEMDKALDEQATALEKAGHSDAVINAYQAVAPLLAENQAISRFINKTGNSSLRDALPEILTASEAMVVASQDRVLSKSEQQTLQRMLSRLEPETLPTD